jgi:micrococcal nuclease
MVARVGQSQCCIWLDLEGNVALRVDREDLDYFARQNFYALQGKQITARGWLYTYSGEVRRQI